MAKGLLVAGTTSDAGKSLVTAGLCRWLARQGVSVAPFKAQNMSNNSMVCPDGSEIGRAQWVQALACGVVPEAAMNPVLLKPGSDRRSHVVLMGRSWGDLDAGEWATGRKVLAQQAFEAFGAEQQKHDQQYDHQLPDTDATHYHHSCKAMKRMANPASRR